MAKLTKQKYYQKIVVAIANLGQDRANQSDSEWLTRLQENLTQLREIAPARAEAYRPKIREQQLISDLLDIWHRMGSQLGTSENGPTARYLEKLLPWRSDRQTLKRYIGDEKKKPRIFLYIDESKISILRAGQTAPSETGSKN